MLLESKSGLQSDVGLYGNVWTTKGVPFFMKFGMRVSHFDNPRRFVFFNFLFLRVLHPQNRQENRKTKIFNNGNKDFD